MTDVVIGAAGRTAIGTFGGTLAKISGADLGAHVIKGVLARAGIAPDQVSEVFMGQVLTAGIGMNGARQASLRAGVSDKVPAMTINMVCGSGLRATHLAAQAIKAGDSEIVVAGGQESMSLSPHVMLGSRDGFRMGDAKLVDSMINDGLWDIFNNYHMGITAENVAKEFKISRQEQDEFAAASQQKAEAAQKAGRFKDEILGIGIPQRKGDPVQFDTDEYPKHGTTVESLAGLRPAFDKAGTVTAGNASGINDGAAAVVLATGSEVEKRGLKPMAKIISWGHAGVEPEYMGEGPIKAVPIALKRARLTLADMDVIEANEAFAAQACAVNKDLGWDPDKVNVNGGAIALGHPIGASGARVLNTLLFEMQRRGAKRGLATLCIGGGMGVAMCVERV